MDCSFLSAPFSGRSLCLSLLPRYIPFLSSFSQFVSCHPCSLWSSVSMSSLLTYCFLPLHSTAVFLQVLLKLSVDFQIVGKIRCRTRQDYITSTLRQFMVVSHPIWNLFHICFDWMNFSPHVSVGMFALIINNIYKNVCCYPVSYPALARVQITRQCKNAIF